MRSALSWLAILLLCLLAWSPLARCEEDLFLQRFSAVRLLMMQSNLWNLDAKNGISLDANMEGHSTSNAELARDGSSDWYSAATVLAAWGHDLGGGWRTSLGADACAFRYLKKPDLGTSCLEAWGALARDLTVVGLPCGVSLSVSQQWTQLSQFTYGGASTELLAMADVEWAPGIGQTISLEPMASITPWSSPWNTGFSSLGSFVSYAVQATANVEFSVFYNGYLTSYFAGQTDFTQYVGAALIWSPCKNLSLSASVIQTWNLSNEAASSYSALDLGGTIALTWSL